MMKELNIWVLRLTDFFILCLFIFTPLTSADEGSNSSSFVSIACCSESNFIDSKNISWVTDVNEFHNRLSCENRTSVGVRVAIGNVNNKTRVFHVGPDQKRCYTLPSKKGQDYLIRGIFGGIWGLKFTVAVDVTTIGVVDSLDDYAVEGVVRATKDYINFCLVSDKGELYISEIHLRPLWNLTYYLEDFPSSVLQLLERTSFDEDDAEKVIRYGVDPSDRIWLTNSTVDPGTYLIPEPNVVNVLGSRDVRVPIQVLKTALASSDRLVILHNGLSSSNSHYLLFLYFYEVNHTVQAGERVFDVYLNSELRQSGFDVMGDGSNYRELALNVTANWYLNLTLVKASESENGPICNAYEILQVHQLVQETDTDDVEVILEVRSELLERNEKNEVWEGWTGDPCLPVPWNGIGCDTVNGVPVITKLDLSSGIQRSPDEERILRGPFPKSIPKLTHLRFLNLSNNEFIGQIPEFLQSSLLISVDLSHNKLSGPLPKSLTSLPNLATLNYGCNPELTEVSPSTFKALKVTTDHGNCGVQESSKRGIIIGAAAVSGSLLVTAVAGIIFFMWRKKFMPRGKSDKKLYPMAKNLIFSLPSMDDLVIKSISIETFTLDYLEAVTQSYKTLIGEGGFGSVYRGTLTDGQEVAVKVRSATSTQGTREFNNELNLLSTIRHENLVPLLGYCNEKDQEILVYPFMSNGSLQDRLYGEAAKRKILDWPTRLSIALGAARGLTHLHNFAGRCIIHRDVKSSNILLDQSMCAKVADFGFSKYAPQEGDSGASLEVRGTAGYLDPEYYTTHHLSTKSDVFSFGVVLLEIVTGREPLNIHRPRPEWSLVEWAKPYIRESKIEEIVDPNIKGAYHAEAMWRVVEVALSCIEPFSAYRPGMADIVRELEDSLIIENNASEYMRSIESTGSNRFSSIMERSIVMDRRIPPPSTPSEPSTILTQMAPPEPR
ncbi:PREDICTED: nodulation receptor kinase-like [Fragaria vesca subsp. vesca]|uniref:nodulation receptor kinase-like n=1 Tax=Fragaria vesca subsp. vesca TaxID=101020 RepID=UPI0002C2DF9B|nr:PREDICTED: nodulation receptor kinase-like [Fragaria vesca subsp. vesca]